MKLFSYLMIILLQAVFLAGGEGELYERDIFQTDKGEMSVYFIGHATLMIEAEGKAIHIDPIRQMGDYAVLPKADLIIITHEHSDHFDVEAIKQASKEGMEIVYTAACAEALPGGHEMANGDRLTAQGIGIEAVPAYNIKHKRSNGQPFHPRGRGNGYILTVCGKRIYIAGDTENIPEMKELNDIDIAFLPMNLPYTMDPEMAAAAAKSFFPKILYPYHYSKTDPQKLVDLLKNESAIEVRIRSLK